MLSVNNIPNFVRVYKLGIMSAAGHDLRISPAGTSIRISQFKEHLGARLFQRTTRHLTPAEESINFYRGAINIVDSIELVEAQINDMTENLKGLLYVAAPSGVGRRLVAPKVPDLLA